MQVCHELTDRQSARVIEQTIQEQVKIRLDPHHSSGLESLAVQLIGEDAEYLTFRILKDQQTTRQGLIPGQYCQAQFTVGGSVYLLSVHIIEVDEADRVVRTGRPKLVQLLERRKFIRTQVAPSTQLELRWLGDEHWTPATLFNIGGGGLAFRAGRDLGDSTAIGDVMEVGFELPGLPRRFELKICICNKTMASDERSVIVGAQFQEMGENPQLGDLDELRRFLVTQQQGSLAR